MPWVPIEQTEAEYTFIPGDSVSMVDSVITYAGGSGADWTFDIITVGVRITAQSYAAGAGNEGLGFTPAAISYFVDELVEAANESSPSPDTTFPDDTGFVAFAPSPLTIGTDETPAQYITYSPTMAGDSSELDTEYQFLVEVWQDDPPPEPEPCEEHGRATRAYVSGYQRDRVHRSRLVRGEKRCLVANFNGAIPASRTIVSATWRCDQNQAVYMANARITEAGRCAAVDITAQIGAGGRVKCQVTLDNGEVYNQLFWARVYSSPWFFGENYSFAQGPTELTATA